MYICRSPRGVFGYIEGLDRIRTECDPEKKYDLLILLDISSADRIGVAGPYVETAGKNPVLRSSCDEPRELYLDA